ncbi:hypothetical protein ABTY61_07665 [Kitasatospora sp. NPDC096128]|uniref:hypothetical protein n=1 Tax=Kitasatospora sp. NPDC096128 TaxID=3155547 RepID=UPI00331DD1B5
MATYVPIHGAGADAWYWGPLAAELRDRGHEVIAADLPCEDESAGLAEYADAVVEAVGGRSGKSAGPTSHSSCFTGSSLKWGAGQGGCGRAGVR